MLRNFPKNFTLKVSQHISHFLTHVVTCKCVTFRISTFLLFWHFFSTSNFFVKSFLVYLMIWSLMMIWFVILLTLMSLYLSLLTNLYSSGFETCIMFILFSWSSFIYLCVWDLLCVPYTKLEVHLYSVSFTQSWHSWRYSTVCQGSSIGVVEFTK